MRYLRNLEPGTNSMREIGEQIYNGAKSFLDEEYKYISIFVILIAILLCIILAKDNDMYNGVYSAACFLAGAFLSGAAG